MENVTCEVKQRLQSSIQIRYVLYLAIRFKLLVDFCDSHKKYVVNLHAIFLRFNAILLLCTICEKSTRGNLDLWCAVRNGGHIFSCNWCVPKSIWMTDADTHRIKIANLCRFCSKIASSKKTSTRPKIKFKLDFERYGVNVEDDNDLFICLCLPDMCDRLRSTTHGREIFSGNAGQTRSVCWHTSRYIIKLIVGFLEWTVWYESILLELYFILYELVISPNAQQ